MSGSGRLRRTYRERVKVFDLDDNEELGQADFSGRARQEPKGLWSWDGTLTNMSPLSPKFLNATTIRLELPDDTKGEAIVINLTESVRSGRTLAPRMHIRGTGTPPRVE